MTEAGQLHLSYVGVLAFLEESQRNSINREISSVASFMSKYKTLSADAKGCEIHLHFHIATVLQCVHSG